ncbi:MAG: diacylglycerol kinase family protein [Oscillospiraceae bacterium]
MIKFYEVKNLARSFKFAFKGVGYCIHNERNMRIHITTTVIVMLFAILFGLSAIEFMILCLCFGFVIVAEMINTGIETLVNLESQSYDSLAKIAKDVAAGAVLVSAITSVIVGIILFLKPQRLLETFTIILTNPIYLILAIAVIFLGILFIFRGVPFISERKTKIYTIKNIKK